MYPPYLFCFGHTCPSIPLIRQTPLIWQPWMFFQDKLTLFFTIHTHLSNFNINVSYCCCCSVIKSCPTFCDPHGLQHARLPCPSLFSGVCSDIMFIELVMLSNHLILCRPLLLLFFQFSSVAQLCLRLFVTPWTAACQASLFITNSRSLLKLMSMESVMPSNHLILCHPLLLLPSIFSSMRVFSNDSALCIRWPKYWSFSFSISPSKKYSGLIFMRMDWLGLFAVQGTLKSLLFSNTTVQQHQFFRAQISL